MIYEPNTNKWPIGALVIHDSDAKRADMLMRVVGYDKVTGECKTRYAYPLEQPKVWRKTIWRNDVQCLHDPARFGIVPPNANSPTDHDG